MTPIEMAEAMEGRARVRRKITNRENLGDRLSDQLEQAAAMLRDQHLRIQQLEQTQEYLFKKHDADKAEIEALKKEAALQRLSDFTQEAEVLKAKMSLNSYDDAQNVAYQLLNENISLWDYFAANALQGLIAGCYSGNNVGFTVEGNVFAACEYADVMIKARKK